jgi:hypothetical protein
MLNFLKSLITLTLFFFPAFVLAANCSNYPYTDGINVEDVAGGTKILATASVALTLDDIDSIKDARDEASMEAKALISKFMSEDISSDETVNRVVKESKHATSSGKDISRDELIERVKKLRNTSKSLLKGAVLLGDCYTPATELRVSIGIKPQTIEQSNNLSTNSHDGNNSKPSSISKGLQSREEYSNTKNLDNF